jgi:adenine-specific DNA-methyltransferase
MQKVVIGNTELYCGDSLEVLSHLDLQVDAIITDPPYFKAHIAQWDNQWKTEAEFLNWLDLSFEQYEKMLSKIGSLYVFASPKMAAKVELLIGQRFNVLNHLVWLKPNGYFKKCKRSVLRYYFPRTERIIFAEQHHADRNYQKLKAKSAVTNFEPIRQYLDDERLAAGLTQKMANEICGNQMAGHYFTAIQWSLPPAHVYAKLQDATGRFQRPYADLKQQQDSLRRAFNVDKKVRRPFFAEDPMPHTEVFEYPMVASHRERHPTEKPVELMRSMILASTHPNQLVLDSFMGSGTTGVAAIQCGRRFVGIERDPIYFERACRRIAEALSLNT